MNIDKVVDLFQAADGTWVASVRGEQGSYRGKTQDEAWKNAVAAKPRESKR